jgi:hypothetical protein
VKELLAQLAQPFEPKHITWKPGATTKDGGKCMAMAYADLRAYQDRLDELMGLDWSVRYTFWGDNRIACELTLYIGDALGRREGITRTSTGEMEAQDEKNGMGGTVAEAQAFKRACAMFGMGRYLYDLPSVWIEFDSTKKRISDAGQKELDARYQQWYARNAMQKPQATQPTQTRTIANGAPTATNGNGDAPVKPANPFDEPSEYDKALIKMGELGESLYGTEWAKVCRRNVSRITNGYTEDSDDLSFDQVQKLIEGMTKLANEKQAQPAAA